MPLALILVSSLVGAVFSARAQEARYGGTIVWAIDGDPQTMLAGVHQYSRAAGVVNNLFVGMLELDFDLSPKPSVAKSWTISPDGLKYTFKLHENVKWHDGRSVTAADVKWTWEQVVTQLHPGGKMGKEIVKSVEAPDDFTVVYNLNYPFGPFLQCLHPYNFGGILPKHIFEGIPPAEITKDPKAWQPVGNGPFMFKEYVKGSHIRMVKNPNYFKPGLPYLDELVIKIIPDRSTMALALEKGEVDYIALLLPVAEAARIGALPNVKVDSRGSEAYMSIVATYFNLWPERESPAKDVKVRQAIAHAIDRKQIADRVTFGLAKTAVGPFPSAFSWAYGPDWPYAYDPAKAESILDGAGYRKGLDGTRFKVKLVFTPYITDVTVSAEMITEFLRKVGIAVDVASMEYASMVDAVYNRKDFDLYIHRLGPSIPDPLGYNIIWSKKYVGRGSVVGVNPSSYANEKIDELFDKAGKELDRDKRGEYFKQITQMVQNDLPAVVLWEAVSLSAYRTEFVGLPVGPWQGGHPLDSVSWTKGKAITTGVATTVTRVTTIVSPTESVVNYGVIIALVLAVLVIAVYVTRARRGKT